jgi:hypothetical protein
MRESRIEQDAEQERQFLEQSTHRMPQFLSKDFLAFPKVLKFAPETNGRK